MTEINPDAAASLVGKLNSIVSGLDRDQYALLAAIFKLAHDISADPSDYEPPGPFDGAFDGDFEPLDELSDAQVKMLLGYATASDAAADSPHVIVKLATDGDYPPDAAKPPTVVKGIWPNA
jgi:hypothetical protein